MTNDNKRGGTVAENGNGKLERVSASTCVGTATTADGKVITKRFRGGVAEEPRITASWEKWQGRKSSQGAADEYYEEEYMEDNPHGCPLSGRKCTANCPMYSMDEKACSLMLGCMALHRMGAADRVSEELGLIAIAIGELKAPTAGAAQEAEAQADEFGVDGFFEDKTFISFVNMHGKGIYGKYRAYCKERGLQPVMEGELLAEVQRRYPELKRRGVRGGSVFEAA